MKTQIIIVAGGKGQRMQSEIPKQFLLLDKQPILMHTIKQFADLDADIFVVLPPKDISLWKDLVDKHHFTQKHTIVEGGEERFFSVKNALDLCSSEGIILIHDGVRPLIAKTSIQNIIKETIENNSAIPITDVQESLRLIVKNESMSVDRQQYKLVQTPQGFKANLIKESYQQDYSPQFTDDASVFEKMGYTVHLVAGHKENIKITSPEDLQLAEYLKSKLIN